MPKPQAVRLSSASELIKNPPSEAGEVHIKTAQHLSIQSSDYRDLPVSRLVESLTNPRRHYGESSLQELAESIRVQGILAPLLVRETGEGRFEIVAGSRRFRAAQLAGVASVPVRVVSLTDAEAIIAQVVENLQRENVHPLEEAAGFRALLDLPGQQFNAAIIAARAGKSPQYVAQRLKLTELIPPVADVFLADRLTLGHALLIAKLPPAQQSEALAAAFQTTWMTGNNTEILISLKELSGWIESNLLLELRAAPFDRSDGSLIPEAGACHDCPKRTGANALLFPETDHDQCLDRKCYQAKVNAHITKSIELNPRLIQISSSWGTQSNGVLGRGQYIQIDTAKPSRKARREAPPESKKCPHIAKAIVVEGGASGHIVDVCADPACETHHAASRQSREEQAKTRNEQRKQEERRKQELLTRRRLLAAILEKVIAPPTKADLELIAREFIHNLPQQYRTLLWERRAPASAKDKKPDPPEIAAVSRNLGEAGYTRLLVEISLLDAVYNAHARDSARSLQSVAKRYRVNVEKIAATVAAEIASRRKDRAKRQNKAKAKSNGSQPTAKSTRA